MAGIIFKDAEPRDLEEIVWIYNSTIPSRLATADLEPITTESRRAWFQAHNPATRPLWIVKDNKGSTIGWVSFSDYYARAAYHITAEVSIYLHPVHRSKGYGKLILDHCILAAPALGIKNLIAVIFSHNEASISLFKKAGFLQWGMLPEVCEMDGKLNSVTILGRKV